MLERVVGNVLAWMTSTNTPSGLSAEQLAAVCGVHITTARRWKRTGNMPLSYRVLVAFLVDGDLGVLSPAWKGWTLRAGEIVTPEGWTFTPGELTAVPIRYQQLAALERRMSEPEQRELRLTLRPAIEPEHHAHEHGDNQALHYPFLDAPD